MFGLDSSTRARAPKSASQSTARLDSSDLERERDRERARGPEGRRARGATKGSWRSKRVDHGERRQKI